MTLLISPGSAGIAELAIFHPVRVLLKSLRRILIPLSGRYNCETFNEQSREGEGFQTMRSLDIMLKDSSDYIRVKTQHRHIQGLRKRRRWSQIHIFVSRSRICCRIQGPSCREKVGKVGVE